MVIQGSRGKIRVFEDFNAVVAASTTVSDATAVRFNELNIAAVSGDTAIISIFTEGGGVLNSATAADGAADGIAYSTAPAIPSENGTMIIEARCRHSSATDFRFFLGFQETYSIAEPVNPYTLSGTTLTANAAGEVVGFYYDSAATTDDFRFMAGANSSASTGATLDYALGGQTTLGSLGVRCNATLTASRWFIGRVEIDADGTARGYFGDETMANTNGLTHIATLRRGELSTTAVYTPVVQLLQSSTGTVTSDIDYFLFEGNRYWEDN